MRRAPLPCLTPAARFAAAAGSLRARAVAP
jgi:hypothetical protein